MSARLADLIYRFRLPLSGAIILGFFALLPLTNITQIDNDISMWISRDDPVYQTYERFRDEFGGQRTLLIALRSERLFTPEGLAFVRQITDDIERVDAVERVASLATANIVTSLPPVGGADLTDARADLVGGPEPAGAKPPPRGGAPLVAANPGRDGGGGRGPPLGAPPPAATPPPAAGAPPHGAPLPVTTMAASRCGRCWTT